MKDRKVRKREKRQRNKESEKHWNLDQAEVLGAIEVGHKGDRQHAERRRHRDIRTRGRERERKEGRNGR